MRFDDIIRELGEFGPYQKRVYFLLCLVGIPAAFQTLVSVFILAIPDHRCAVPGLDNDTYESQGHWHDQLVNMTVPKDTEDDNIEYAQCKLYQRSNSSTLFTNETESCNKWVYSKDPFESTFVEDANLVCEDKGLRTYANMILMGGMMAGSVTLGTLSDIIGRKKVLMIGLVGRVGASLGNAFVSSYTAFVILRFLTTFFGQGVFIPAFIIGMEVVGPSKRKFTGIVIEIFWVIGLFIMDGIAYGIRDWRLLQIVLSVPIPVCLVVMFIFFLPESPRWLLNKSRYKEASKILQDAAKGNGVTLSEKALDLENIELEGKGEQIWHMFTTPSLLIRSLIIFFNWLVASMVFYGLSLNVGSLSGDIYLNFFLSALVELAAYIVCLLFLDCMGRKPLQCSSMLIGGVACICTLFPVIYGNDDVKWVTTTLSLIGKFGASAAFAVIYVYAAELFPTVMRNAGMGLSSFSARIGGIMAPYIADIGHLITGDFAIALPLLIFGGFSILAGLLALLLPETANRILPDTVEDAKNFGKTSDKRSYDLKELPPDEKDGKYNPSFKMDDKF